MAAHPRRRCNLRWAPNRLWPDPCGTAGKALDSHARPELEKQTTAAGLIPSERSSSGAAQASAFATAAWSWKNACSHAASGATRCSKAGRRRAWKKRFHPTFFPRRKSFFGVQLAGAFTGRRHITRICSRKSKSWVSSNLEMLRFV